MSETNLLDPAMLSVILTFALGLFGSIGKLVQIRTKLSAIKNVVSEIEKSISDNKITPEESQRIITAFKALVK